MFISKDISESGLSFEKCNSLFLVLLKANSPCRSLGRIEQVSQTLTSRRLWIESWKLVKSHVRLNRNFWCSSLMLNCIELGLRNLAGGPPPRTQFHLLERKRPNHVGQKFHFVLEALNIHSDPEESRLEMLERAAKLNVCLESYRWMNNCSEV